MNEDQRLDTLLNALPLEPLPVGLTERVMGEIRPNFAPFRLNLSDVLLALAFTVIMIVGLYYTVIPIAQDLTFNLPSTQTLSNPQTLVIAFLLLIELLLGGAIYLSIAED